MGINGLWSILGDGEIIHIADLATRHFRRHQRPLRIAVDEACWRFTNLTAEQVERVREGEPAANPVEKTILWRILRLLRLNVRLLFVFDGQRKPGKTRNRGRGGTRIDFELTRLLKQLLDHLKVPHHQAPGEAEAECAKLQCEGVVDAVWADDSDALMFGCTMLIKAHKVNQGDRVKDFVKVFTADYLRDRFGLDRHSLVLFALLAGGDYDDKGLPGCGPETARLLCQREDAIVAATVLVEADGLFAWRALLTSALEALDKRIAIPPGFPSLKVLNGYRRPAVSSAELSTNLDGPRRGWEVPLDQMKLRPFLRQRFNFRTREFIKHITPVLLARALSRATVAQKVENLHFGVRKKRTRKVNVEPDHESFTRAEVKITFSPLPLLEIDVTHEPPDEDWSIWDAKDGTKYDPLENIECEMLSCFLDHGLPEGSFDAPPLERKTKRKVGADADIETNDIQTFAKKQRRASQQIVPSNSPPELTRTCSTLTWTSMSSASSQSHARQIATQDSALQATPSKSATKTKVPSARFKLPSAPVIFDARLFDVSGRRDDDIPAVIEIDGDIDEVVPSPVPLQRYEPAPGTKVLMKNCSTPKVFSTREIIDLT